MPCDRGLELRRDPNPTGQENVLPGNGEHVLVLCVLEWKVERKRSCARAKLLTRFVLPPFDTNFADCEL